MIINKKYYSLLSLAMTLLLIMGCDRLGQPDSPTTKVKPNRWYSQAQIDQGRILFKENCSQCHGQNAQGTFNWNKPLPDGSYPPPPLNGSAHAWHHPLSATRNTIRQGSLTRGGKMPSFENTLSQEEIDSVIAFFQNKWSQEKYQAWIRRGGLK